MSTNNDKRNYNMTDAELCMYVSNLCNFLTRDLADLEQFGLTSDKIESFKELGDEFEVFPTDGTLIGDVMITTEDKNALRERVLSEIKAMAFRVESKWGANSARYKRLDLSTPSSLTDDSLLVTARTIQIKMTDYLDDLSEFGLTQDMLDAFAELNEDFERAKNAQSDAVALRDEKTLERITRGNELYALVTRYTGFGKLLYEKTNSAKYNDYLIYSSGSGGSSGGGTNPNAPAAPTNFRYDYAERMIRWNSVSGATSYFLESSMNNVDWEEIYQGDATEYNTGEMLAEHTYLRIRSHSINGYSPYANLNIVYDLVLNGPANLTHNPALPGFTWNPVAGATAYEVQLRDSNATDDDYINLYFGNSTQLYHADQVGTYYVRIRAWNNEGTSPWMLLAYVIAP